MPASWHPVALSLLDPDAIKADQVDRVDEINWDFTPEPLLERGRHNPIPRIYLPN